MTQYQFLFPDVGEGIHEGTIVKWLVKKGDVVNAFACLNYAHGWLDAGARLGLFDVDGDNVLFTVDEKK